VVAAVASRDRQRAEQFIEECSREVPFEARPAACGSYEEILTRDDVDAVYIPLPTGIRKEWVIRAAEAKKPILCEKPCAPTAADLREMLAVCRRNNVLFQDGVMFMHSQRLPKLRAILDDGQTVGPIKRISSEFCFAAPPEFFQGNIRANSTLEPLGCLGDLGWYNIRLALWVMNYTRPTNITARLLDSVGPDRVPTEFSAEMTFPSGASATFYCSFRTELQQWATISGVNGSVHLNDFVLPFHGPEVAFTTNQPIFTVRNTTFHMASHARRHAVAEFSDGEPDSQETRMVRHFAEQVQSGKPAPEWGEIALLTQEVLEECLLAARSGR
jgi:predicted dehydrogenase